MQDSVFLSFLMIVIVRVACWQFKQTESNIVTHFTKILSSVFGHLRETCAS